MTKLRFLILFALLWIGLPYVYANTYSQATRISISVKKGSLEETFKEIEKKTGYGFLYKNEILKGKGEVQVEAEDELLTDVLDDLLTPLDLAYIIDDNVIVVNLRHTKSKSLYQEPKEGFAISGTVIDERGEPLPGVTISLKKDRTKGSTTDINGNFHISNMKIHDVLVFSFIGMEIAEVSVKQGQTVYTVTLKSSSTQLKDVVVEAGIIQRDKRSFTGAFTTATGEELRAFGTQNILQSLQGVDPSFIIPDNSIMGSSPNAMPNVEIRGQADISAVQDDAQARTNQPLYILDGFEVSVRDVNDLDINRVESVTILKDASSTAIYGSKGANGVVVIETIKPKAGEIFLRYNADFGLSYADLTGYNMMNSAENLEYELLAGRYSPGYETSSSLTDQMQLYYKKLANVQEGVDTYWLKVPLKTAITHKHSATISGGSDSFLFLVGLNYGNQEGVMKKEYRKSFGGNTQITYRTDKLNISNNLMISGTNSQASPYAPFSNFVNANPYYRMKNKDGSIPQFLEKTPAKEYQASVGEVNVPNPLWNALLESKDNSKYFKVTNNTSFRWYFNQNFMLGASLGLTHETTKQIVFVNPDDTRYDGKSYTEKGNYKELNTSGWSYDASILANYSKLIDDLHNIAVNARANIFERNSNTSIFEAEGFPSGSSGSPSSSYSYRMNSRPNYNENTVRGVTALLTFSYSYKNRYMFDANYNIDGSNNFGTKKKYAPFWSIGAGWNLSQEKFAENWDWLSDFRVRGTYGTTGSQSIQHVTESIYLYYTGSILFGQGYYLSQLANPYLDWDKTRSLSINTDVGLFKDRVKLYFNYFNDKKKPRIFMIDQKPSSGVSSYPINMGYTTNEGVELSLSYAPIYNIKDRIILRFVLSGIHNKNTYGGLNNIEENSDAILTGNLEGNRQLLSDRSMRRYRNGYSPDDLWAVKSLGVDPTTGKEVFLKRDGVTRTFSYDEDDRVKIGSTRPKISGTFNIAFSYKRFDFNMLLKYRIGANILNTDLYNKVENITFKDLIYNQDRRALYDKWKEPGDVAKFVTISAKANIITPATSRFVQKENMLSAESIRVSLDFSRDKWIKALKLSELKFSIYMNNIFNISTIKQERSTAYPFARAIYCNISTRF